MVKAYRPGVEARHAILRELRRMELARLPAPSVVTLAAALGEPRSTTDHHVVAMVRMGWLTRTTGRTAAVYLTDIGRNAAPPL
jgi:DNA-binding MarR family transcriptional regulator